MFRKKEEEDLSRLRPETAKVYKRMKSSSEKRPLSSSMPLFYPGAEDNVPADRTPPAPSVPRAVLRSGLRPAETTSVRRFTLSAIKEEPAPAPRSYPSLSFPDLRRGTEATPSRAEAVGAGTADDRAVRTETVRPTVGKPASARSDGMEYVAWNPKKEGASSGNRSVSGGTILEVNQLHKGYVKGKNLIPVLNGVDIRVRDGEFLAVVGQSGSGKSTLLHLMGTLDVPDSGTVHFDGQRIDNLPSRRRDFLRNHYIGMIFQFYHLIPEMNMIENVLTPFMVRESLFGYLRRRREYTARAKELLDLVGLSHRIKHRPNELSGGEMQRTSIARALITNPRVLLADEPTGNLDSKTTVEIIKLLRSLNAEKKLTIIMVTHDMEQARDADRVVRLVDGQVVESFWTGF
ncbi:MAG: ATP-binding cassette domain-containing protein [Thermoguttaceae bacterium]|jgi:lipoprotein-releasing system ATP-binding protein